MLNISKDIPFDEAHWQRINMRSVSHLLGAEMLHNLYNRHWPRINSLRFRHTVTTYHKGIVEAYAPKSEWSYLQNWLSKKFISLDPILIREIDNILNPDYEFIDELIKKTDTDKLSLCSDEDLALLLIDIMDHSLGEIYKLNVVQIEYSLNYALHKVLEEYEPNIEDRNLLLSRLISPGELTVSQVEEVAFGAIVNEFLSDAGEFSSNADIDLTTLNALRDHHKKYAASHCAYGETPPSVEDYISRFRALALAGRTLLTAEDALKDVERQRSISFKMLEKLNNQKLTTLCNLMSRIGVFRDKNKAKLGQTVVRRLDILNEISMRKQVPLEKINLYLLSDLTSLLETGKKVTDSTIVDRSNNGVSFVRTEEVVRPIFIHLSKVDHLSITEGICASPGSVRGAAKIVHSKDDAGKVNEDDIMIAIGTDFDLLEIMNVCKGIITEEGGLLSHASVVSRELKKPCLIGVLNATKIYHDGDIITLNATEGRVVLEDISK